MVFLLLACLTAAQKKKGNRPKPSQIDREERQKDLFWFKVGEDDTEACEEVDESDETKPIFRRPQDISSYSTAYTMSATKWGARQDPLHRGPVGASFRPKLGFRPSSANSRRSRQDEEMSPPLSERSFGKLSGQMPLKHSQTQAVLGVPQQRVDFLLRQLRLLSTLLQLLMLVKSAQLFSAIAVLPLYCKSLGEALVCSRTFKVQSTLAAFTYLAITLVQQEIVHRLERVFVFSITGLKTTLLTSREFSSWYPMSEASSGSGALV